MSRGEGGAEAYSGGGAIRAKPPRNSEIYWFQGVSMPQRVLSPPSLEKKNFSPPREKFLNTPLGGDGEGSFIYWLKRFIKYVTLNTFIHLLIYEKRWHKYILYIASLWCRNPQVESENPQMNINTLKKQKHEYLIHTWSDKGFKGTVVNRALSSLHAGSLEIIRTVTLIVL